MKKTFRCHQLAREEHAGGVEHVDGGARLTLSYQNA